jgi:3,4-dihydroxy 2-butanone 4-phosphate synthase / GTP cyclohydrolase II
VTVRLDETAEIRLDPVTAAVESIRAGRPVIVVDDADRENEGDVILAAAHADEQWVGWTVRHTSGLLCAPLPTELADRLDLPQMVERNQDPRGTAYTVSVDAAAGVTTGISAADRARTVRMLADPASGPADLIRPGHILPLRARPGGVLERRGHTEAAVDLCRLAGLSPVGVIAEVVTDTGAIMRGPGLRELADEYGLPMISIADLVDHRLAGHPDGAPDRDPRQESEPGAVPVPPAVSEERVYRVAETVLPTRYGQFRAVGYQDRLTGEAHVALVAAGGTSGTPGTDMDRPVLVRVHSECLTGDALGSLRCDCGPQLHEAMRMVARHGGVLVYLGGHEGRGIGLLPKLTAYGLQDHGMDTVAANESQGLPADAREYGAAAAILTDLGVGRIRLLTNNPAKVQGLERFDVDVTERVPIVIGHRRENHDYLVAKRDLMGHLLELDPSIDIKGSDRSRDGEIR